MPTTHKIRQERSSGSASSPMTASPRRSGRVQVRSRRSDRSTQLRRKPSSSPDWSVDNRDGHVRISTFAGRPLPNEGGERSSSGTAPRAGRRAGRCNSCGSGCRRPSVNSSPGRAISRWSGATAAFDTGSTPGPRSTCARSTREVAYRWDCVSCPSALCRSETSCSPKRSRWKHARVRFALWPGGSHPTVSISGKHGLSGKPNLAQTGAEPC